MTDKSNQMTGGEIIAKTLHGYGVQTVACLSGTAHTHLLFALENNDIRIVSGRHETATVAVADGYARVAGRLGVALIKADQGLPNDMSGILTAQQACSPVIVLVSMLPNSKREAADEWPNDWLDIVKPYVKWARTVSSVDRLEEFVHAAARNALNGRPGVALLGIPQQFEGEAVEAIKTHRPPPPLGPRPNEDSINRAADLLSKAKRPMVLAGTGAALSGAGPSLRNLAKAFRYPIIANALGRGLVPEDMTLGFPWHLAQAAAKDADVVLVVGMRLTERIGYGLAPRFAADAKFIQVDIEAEEIGRNREIDVPIHGDAQLSVDALYKALKKRKVDSKGDPQWVNKSLEARLNRIEELGNNAEGPIHPYKIGRELMDQMPANAIYVGDGADVQNWMHAILRIKSERGFLDHYPLGSMGIGTPLAIGAAAAARDMAEEYGVDRRPVVLVTATAPGGRKSMANSMPSAVRSIASWVSGTTISWQIYSAETVKRLNSRRMSNQPLKRAFTADTFSIINILTDPMAGLVRKQDPRVQTVAFEDLVSSLKTHHLPDVA